jgi:hypothetical protein
MISGAGARYPAKSSSPEAEHENAPDLTSRGRSRYLEHETGLASACRFAAGALRKASEARPRTGQASDCVGRDSHVGKEMLGLLSLRFFA